MEKWISVKDRLPDFNRRVLCYYQPIHPIMEVWTIGVLKRHDILDIPVTSGQLKNFDENGFAMAGYVSHWIPIPEPPKR